jgi:hypothetical protein
LDLSTPIKNPRRDFSNGFLAAELMGRFYVSVSTNPSAHDGGLAKPTKPLCSWRVLRSVLYLAAALHHITPRAAAMRWQKCRHGSYKLQVGLYSLTVDAASLVLGVLQLMNAWPFLPLVAAAC